MKQTQQTHEEVSGELFSSLHNIFRIVGFEKNMNGKAPAITLTQMRVLSTFNAHDVVHISEVSRALNMSIQSVNNLVKRLEVMGYVERTQNSRDRRLSDIHFTKKGRRGFDQFRAEQFGILQLLIQELSGAERKKVYASVACAAQLLEKAALNAAAKNAAASAG